jgi:hypothetical protein
MNTLSSWCQYLGQFKCISGEIVVSDPCYELGIGTCTDSISNAIIGNWEACITIRDFGYLGNRVTHLCANAVGFPSKNGWRLRSRDIGVDTGQAGLFDRQYFRDPVVTQKEKWFQADRIDADDVWYSLCCDRTLTSYGAVIPFGVVSRSAFGDGFYRCHVCESGGRVSAIAIEFVDDFEMADHIIDNLNAKGGES